MPASPGSRSARSLRRRPSCAGSAGGIGADVAEAVAAARAAGIGSINLDLLYDVPDRPADAGWQTLDAALDLGPDHLSLYALTLDDPDAEGLTGPAGDHLPMTRGARAGATAPGRAQDEDRAAAQYHHAVHRLGDGRLARLRDLELGPARPREPPQPRLLGAPPVRGGRARAPTPSTARRGAGTPPGSTATSRR